MENDLTGVIACGVLGLEFIFYFVKIFFFFQNAFLKFEL